jgi:hypothetical protein
VDFFAAFFAFFFFFMAAMVVILLMSVAVGRWSSERRGFGPWARSLTVNDDCTGVRWAQEKNGKNPDISVA